LKCDLRYGRKWPRNFPGGIYENDLKMITDTHQEANWQFPKCNAGALSSEVSFSNGVSQQQEVGDGP
jgi:hypothetical protein